MCSLTIECVLCTYVLDLVQSSILPPTQHLPARACVHVGGRQNAGVVLGVDADVGEGEEGGGAGGTCGVIICSAYHRA